MQAVSYSSKGETKPIESKIETLRSRLSHFNLRLSTIDDEIEVVVVLVSVVVTQPDGTVFATFSSNGE